MTKRPLIFILSPEGSEGLFGYWDFGHYLVIGSWCLVLHIYTFNFPFLTTPLTGSAPPVPRKRCPHTLPPWAGGSSRSSPASYSHRLRRDSLLHPSSDPPC